MNSKSVEVLLGDADNYDKEAIEKVLKRAKFKVTESSKMSALPL
ncbi:hypothetical protein N9A89_06230 [Akkermansiaceae bacterium]|nr:hypothetical protein [Akkermansiaceae bacterium]MDA7898583.1 hypothetical protein [bacterium]MDA7518588.1 hypothetical protein [Akkermansiaceae bacterium]MDA7535654.1 hypothetical protein [Akkermansiaceae bacterium]MDA7651254.1 hypothetical protein [Akkermansiaceae bacterium]